MWNGVMIPRLFALSPNPTDVMRGLLMLQTYIGPDDAEMDRRSSVAQRTRGKMKQKYGFCSSSGQTDEARVRC